MASNRPKLPIVVPKDGFYFPPEAGLPATPRLAGYPTTPRSATVPRSATAGSEYPFPAAKPLASRPTGKTDLYDESVRSSTAVQRNIARFRTTGFGRFLTRVGTSTSDFMYRVSPAPSWRSSVLMFAGSASVVFCLNLAFTIWTLTMLPEGSNFVDGIGVFAEGDCSYIRSANIVVHLLINVLSTILLAGSNFCMQVLSAPTRREVDEAHARGRWLDIGVPSLRNWASVSWMSRFLWFLLGVSSIPLHFFYNSTLFASTSVNLYDVFLVSSPSLAAATAALRSPERIPPDTGDSDLDLMLNLFAAGQLIPLSPQDCFRAYSRPFQSTHSSLLLVTPDQQVGEPARRVVSAPRPGSPEREIQASLDFACGRRPAYQWVCSQFPTAAPPNPSFDNVNTGGLFSGNLSRLATSSTQNGACPAPCDDFLAAISANVTSQWRPFNVSSVSSCHARASRERCKLMFSPLLSVIVTILNLLKAGLMFAVAWRRTEPPLLTVGDAIASFLETTDYVSKAAGCLLDRREAMARDRRRRRRFWRRIWNRFRGVRERNPREEMEEEEAEAGWGDPKQFVDNRPPRFNAASFRRWFATMFFYIGSLTVASLLTWYGINSISARDSFIPTFAFGAVVEIKTLVPTGIEFMPGAAGLVINVVAANVAQVLMSLVYFFYNGLFTTMALATEWADFARERKGLRVSSDPVGFQRAAYFLQLPYRYAVPLIVVSGVMHWLVSQSVFLVYLEAFVPTTVRVPPIFQANTLSTPPLPNSIAASASTALLPPLPVNHLITFGWSPKALTVLLALSFFILLTLVAVGWRRLPTGMPLAGSCSLAIAAACHGPEVEARGWMRPLQWGAVEDVNMVSSNAGMLASRKTTASFGGGSGRKGAPGGTETTEKGLARMGFGAASGVNFSLPGTAGAKAMRVGATRDRPGHCAFSSRNVEYPVEGGWYI